MAQCKQNAGYPEFSAAMGAGCSAICWPGGGGRHLYGRNLDFDRLAKGTGILFVPGDHAYQCCIDAADDRPAEHFRSRYAVMGMGLMLPGGTAALYDGINEKGLMGAQLYYRGFAHFDPPCDQGTRLQPPLLVTHLLSQCSTVEEAVRLLQEVQGVSMRDLQKDGVVRRFDLGRAPDILLHASGEGQALTE